MVFNFSFGCCRCEIPQCDINNTTYDPEWLSIAVPLKDSVNHEPYRCIRYKYKYSFSSNKMDNFTYNMCTPEFFDINFTEKCDMWVFTDTERTIVNDFHIMCDENKWKLSMVGTINIMGQLIGIPTSGFISDK